MSANTPKSRRPLPSTAWKPGQSGNPNGRPKIAQHVREMARAHTDAALRALVQALESPDERLRVTAANSLLDRGYGKPAAHPEPDEDLSNVSDAELIEVFANERGIDLVAIAKGGGKKDDDGEPLS